MNSNTIFIGREVELDRLRRDVFFVDQESFGYCYSIIGLNGIGKTSLIRQLCEEFEQRQPLKTFYYATVLEDGISFWDYWINLLRNFSEDITPEFLADLFPTPTTSEKHAIKKILKVYQFANSENTNIDTTIYKSQLAIMLNDIFKYYTVLGVRIIISIDEFDRAESIFKDGQFFQKLFGLTPKGSPTKLNLSIITISRRRVCTIAHHMQEGSNFEDAFPPIAIKGFTNQNLDEYFNSYKSLPCGYPTEEVKKQILYLCGRSPGLLMGFRHEIANETTGITDIGTIYAEHGQFIKNAYNRMITLMEKSYVDRDCERPLLEIFIQQFIGPICDDNFDVELPLLYDHGFITKATDTDNIFVKSSAKIVHPGSELFVYEPIAPYFVKYIEYFVLPNKLNNLSGILVKAEKLMRDIIQTEMSAEFPDNWIEIVNTYAEKKDYYLESLRLMALKNDFSSSNISKLNVMSFMEYYFIVKKYWYMFAKYFSDYANKDELHKAMYVLNEARNTSAHLNLKVYNNESRADVRKTCEKFIKSIESQVEKANMCSVPSETLINEWTNNKVKVIFYCEAIKMPKGNLRGRIKGYNFSASISKKSLDEFELSKPPQIGDEIEAYIDVWDKGAQLFNLKASK